MEAPYIPPELNKISERIAQGERPTVTVRVLLSWFYGAQRRGRWIVSIIREALNALNIQTQPDFDAIYIDDPVTLLPRSEQEIPAAPQSHAQPEAHPGSAGGATTSTADANPAEPDLQPSTTMKKR